MLFTPTPYTWYFWDDPTHQRPSTHGSLEHLAKDTGLRVIESKYSNTRFFPQSAQKWLRLPPLGLFSGRCIQQLRNLKMHIKHTVLGKGDKKILFDIEMLLYYKQEFDELVKSGEYTFYFLERKQFTSLFSHDFLNRVSFSDLDKTYKKNSDLKDYYQSLLSFCREEKVKACVFTSTGQYWHPDFLNLLKRE